MTAKQKRECEVFREQAAKWIASLERHDYTNVGHTAELLGGAHALIAAVKHGWLIGEKA